MSSAVSAESAVSARNMRSSPTMRPAAASETFSIDQRVQQLLVVLCVVASAAATLHIVLLITGSDSAAVARSPASEVPVRLLDRVLVIAELAAFCSTRPSHDRIGLYISCAHVGRNSSSMVLARRSGGTRAAFTLPAAST